MAFFVEVILILTRLFWSIILFAATLFIAAGLALTHGHVLWRLLGFVTLAVLVTLMFQKIVMIGG